MIWDMFSGRRKGQTGPLQDRFYELIKGIERSAPKNFKGDRESYYYNYRTLALYAEPLYALLLLISNHQGSAQDRVLLTRELFPKLKDFYDPKRRLAFAEALADTNLKQKLKQIFLIFYNMKEVGLREIEISLHDLAKEG